MMLRNLKLFLIFSLWPLTATGEYRAYELSVESSETGKGRQVVTTLGPRQYGTYYPLSQGEVVVYVNSWMCYGNQDHGSEICPNPRPNIEGPVPQL